MIQGEINVFLWKNNLEIYYIMLRLLDTMVRLFNERSTSIDTYGLLDSNNEINGRKWKLEVSRGL